MNVRTIDWIPLTLTHLEVPGYCSLFAGGRDGFVEIRTLAHG